MIFERLKKTIRLSLIASGAFLMLLNVFLSCSVSPEEEDDGEKIKCLVDNCGGLISYSDASRTLTPTVSSSDLVYYFAYQNEYESNTSSWQIEKNISITASGSSSGTFSYTLSPDSYNFYLFAATKKNAAILNAVQTLSFTYLDQLSSYRACTTMDTRSAQNVYFILREINTSSANGSFNISINTAGGWTIPSDTGVTVGIYDIDDDSLVYPLDGNAETVFSKGDVLSAISGYKFFPGTDSSSPEYTVPCGEYNLIVSFTVYGSTSDDNKVYNYEEKIIILANQITEGTLDVPDLIGKAPDAPDCFIAGYKEPSSENAGTYSVQFKWSDNSKNENNFDLQVLKLNGDSAVTLPEDDDDWSDLRSSYGGTLYYDSLTSESGDYVTSGGVTKDSCEITMSLVLGKRYTARLRSVNDAGPSDWTYVIFPQTSEYSVTVTDENGSTKTHSASLDDDVILFDDDVTTINLHRVTYNLQGGYFSSLKDGSAVSSPSVVIYESQHNQSSSTASFSTEKNAVLSPDGISENSYKLSGSDASSTVSDCLTLIRNGLTWKYWTEGTSDLDTDTNLVSSSIIFVESPSSYVSGILYYSNAGGTLCTTQPESSTYDSSGLYVRKVTLTPYKGYENVSYFAHYFDEDSEDFSSYYFKPEYISLLITGYSGYIYTLTDDFTISSKTYYYDESDTTQGSEDYYTLNETQSSTCMEISKSLVKTITFAKNNLSEKRGINYSDIKLTVKSFGSSGSTLIDSVSYDTNKWWTLPIVSQNWETGNYGVWFTAYSEDYPDNSFTYYMNLTITD